jgi:hypothetical protein
MGRRGSISKPSFLETNPSYLLKYNEFRKVSREWNGSGQYWLGKEYYNRAQCLMNGDYQGGMVPVRSELFFYNKNTGMIGNN